MLAACHKIELKKVEGSKVRKYMALIYPKWKLLSKRHQVKMFLSTFLCMCYIFAILMLCIFDSKSIKMVFFWQKDRVKSIFASLVLSFLKRRSIYKLNTNGTKTRKRDRNGGFKVETGLERRFWWRNGTWNGTSLETESKRTSVSNGTRNGNGPF